MRPPVSSPSTEGAFSLERFLDRERVAVEGALGQALDALLPLLDPQVRDAVRQGVTSGGKRLRPILCVAAYRACGGPDEEGARQVAAALELIHAYSLMHDDLPCMDDAPLRRGRPTPHAVHGEASTVLGAGALIPAAHLHLWHSASEMGLPDGVRRDLVRILARAAGAGGMVGGQALDLLGEGRRLERGELDGLHRRKTGALLTAALSMGAVAARAQDGVREALEAYGRAIGLAFQIADDVLDATADADALGKNPSDAELDKSTYVALLGVAEARGEARRLVREAREALRDGGIESPALDGLAAYVVDRDR